MTKVMFGNCPASLDGRTWTAERPVIQQLLQKATDALWIHGGTPDVEAAIVAQLGKELPLKVVAATPLQPGGAAAGVFF